MVARNNKKEVLISNADSILKSSDFSMAKMNHGLSLNQMQLLAYAIFATQKDKATTFIKADFEKKFDLDEYRVFCKTFLHNIAKKKYTPLRLKFFSNYCGFDRAFLSR